MIYRVILILFILSISTANADKPLNAFKSIRVGVIIPLTGSSAAFGKKVRSGMELAASEGVELIFEDSLSNSKSALTAYRKLRELDNIKYLISVGGETCEVLNEAAQIDKVVHIAVGCNTGIFEKDDSYSFRMDVNEQEAARLTADYLKASGKLKAALINIENNWGGTVIKFTKEAFKSGGITITDHITFPDGGIGNLRSELTKVKGHNPDIVFFVAPPEDVAVLLKQLDELQVDIPRMSTISVESPDVLRLAGKRANGIVYLSVKSISDSEKIHPKFYKAFKDKNTFASWGYDSVNLIRSAHNSKAPKAYLQRLTDYIGAFNKYQYNKSGELLLSYEIKTHRKWSIYSSCGCWVIKAVEF